MIGVRSLSNTDNVPKEPPCNENEAVENVNGTMMKSPQRGSCQTPHRGPIKADDDIRSVGSIHVWRVVVLVVDKNVQRRFHFGDDRFRSYCAHQQKPVAFALLPVQRGGHNQLCGVLIHGKRCWALCRQKKLK